MSTTTPAITDEALQALRYASIQRRNWLTVIRGNHTAEATNKYVRSLNILGELVDQHLDDLLFDHARLTRRLAEVEEQVVQPKPAPQEHRVLHSWDGGNYGGGRQWVPRIICTCGSTFSASSTMGDAAVMFGRHVKAMNEASR